MQRKETHCTLQMQLKVTQRIVAYVCLRMRVCMYVCYAMVQYVVL